MQKGISPIVAVVLLIAIAVIAAVGLYFWVGGLATQQPTPSKPLVLSAQGLTCGTCVASSPGSASGTTVMVQNLDPSNSLSGKTLYITTDNGTAQNKTTVTIGAGQQAVVNFSQNAVACDIKYTVGNTYVIYGTSGVAQAQFVCQTQ